LSKTNNEPVVDEHMQRFNERQQWKKENAEKEKARLREKLDKRNRAVVSSSTVSGETPTEGEGMTSVASTEVKRGRGRPPKAETLAKREQESVRDGIVDIFMAGMKTRVAEVLHEEIAAKTDDIQLDLMMQVDELKAQILAEQERLAALKTVTVIRDAERVTLEKRTHKQFDVLLKMVSTGFPTIMVGPAGSGKTTSAEQVAEALGLEFYAESVGAQTSKSDIKGYNTAVGQYNSSLFYQAYVNGGLFLMDEIDAGNANVLVSINAAIANTSYAFPDGMQKKHSDFYFIAAANTYGNGANRQYVGRQQLDAATLDRFITLDWEIDEELERTFIEHYTDGVRWHKTVVAVRKVVNDRSYRVIVSPRATMKGASLLHQGLHVPQVIDATILAGVADEQRKHLKEVAVNAWAYADNS
jgi:MoxR-like ATPase